MDAIVKESAITITVGLNAENVPVSIAWQADDNPNASQPEPCKAILLALFEAQTRETLRIDLWTKDFQVLEMDRMMYFTLRGLADTYFRATQNRELASDFQQFVQYFGEKTEILPKGE